VPKPCLAHGIALPQTDLREGGVGLTDLTLATGDAVRTAGSYVASLATPTVRLGVTGLARAGKTVFITALVRNLVAGGRLPFFSPFAEGRLVRAWLEPQPDDQVPRFAFEEHLALLAKELPEWPDSTRRISQLRVTMEFEPSTALRRMLGVRQLHLDIVDYPGEWLLDLPMLEQDYASWSRDAVAQSRLASRASAAAGWLQHLAVLAPDSPADEQVAIAASRSFTEYLRKVRSADTAPSLVGPGRFLLPGDLEGSPLLAFCPLDAMPEKPASGSLAAMMQRRYDAYRQHVVRPFYRDHFSRLDRQIVLVDVLAALDAGPAAVVDLESALGGILASFRPGANGWFAALVGRRIDKVLFAATKADHLHHENHDRLEAFLSLLTKRAMSRATGAGAEIRSVAIAALRATREGEINRGGERLACIIGVPMPGERIGNRTFDGRSEAAIFPGDLPNSPELLLAEARKDGGIGDAGSGMRFVRFRPPRIDIGAHGTVLPHIRLDRALNFLIGDKLQ